MKPDKNHHFGNFSSQNKQGKAQKDKEKKNRYDEFLPNPKQRIQKKKMQKNSKI